MTYNTINNDVTMAGEAKGSLGRIDKYELRRELGEGGFGAVYLAHDTVAEVDVAVKGLPPEVKHNAAELESIRKNFALVKRLRHPNIVAVTDLHQAVAVSYTSKDVESKLRVFERDTMVVMDYAPGVTLAHWRRQFPGGKVPPGKAIAVVRQVASALDYAHSRKVLHRDVKPANVMVETTENGTAVARVLDFGLAAEIRSSMGRLSREIRDTSGTRPYMAPEQWKGDRQGPATDQYALAAMFYELVAGEVPFASVFDCGDAAVMRLAVTTDAPKMPPSLPRNMRKALAVALAKKPEDRFASCGDFVAALEGRTIPRGSGWAVLAAAALLAAIAGGGWIYRQHEEVRQREEARRNEEARMAHEAAEAEKRKSREEASAANKRQDEAAAGERAAEFVRMKTRINIKKSNAKQRMDAIAEFRTDPEGLAKRISSADSQWQTIAALAEPLTLEEAKAAFEIASEAESQIASDLDWLQKNKAGRDAAKSARASISTLLNGDAATFKAEKYASDAYQNGKSLLEEGEAAFAKGDFAEAGRLMEQAHAKFANAAKGAKAFFVKTTLGSAQEYFSASQWQSCIAECD
ncbi:MAG: protein kinase, partial [Kiritimatiellae bacterium]|nr:protein kinase [Kiritimatiellia bacterium]